MKQLYFIRHGESEANTSNRWSGSSESPLTPAGREQARQSGLLVLQQGIKPDLIIASPLSRAQDTAKEIAKTIDYPLAGIATDKRLLERSLGSLEGKRRLGIALGYLFSEAFLDRYPGVEKFTDLQKRAETFLEYVGSLPQDTILLVSHGAFGRALRRAANNQPLAKRGKYFNNAEIARLI